MFFVGCLSQYKAAMICYRLFERELYSSGGHPGEAMGKSRRHAVRALSGLPRKVSCLQRRVSAMPTVTQRLNVVKSSCCVTPSYALLSFSAYFGASLRRIAETPVVLRRIREAHYTKMQLLVVVICEIFANSVFSHIKAGAKSRFLRRQKFILTRCRKERIEPL